MIATIIGLVFTFCGVIIAVLTYRWRRNILGKGKQIFDKIAYLEREFYHILLDLKRKRVVKINNNPEYSDNFDKRTKIKLYRKYGKSKTRTNYQLITDHLFHFFSNLKTISKNYSQDDIFQISSYELERRGYLEDINDIVTIVRTITEVDLERLDTICEEIFNETLSKTETILGKYHKQESINFFKIIFELDSEDKTLSNLIDYYFEKTFHLLHEFKIDISSLIDEIESKGYSIIMLFNIGLEMNKRLNDIFKTEILNAGFSKVNKFTLTYLKLVKNKELKKYKSLKKWLKAKLGNIFRDLEVDVEGLFLVISFSNNDYFEFKTDLSNEEISVNRAILEQMANINDLQDKVFESNKFKFTHSKFFKLNPFYFFQQPREFLNCVLNKEINKKTFKSKLKNNRLDIKQTSDFKGKCKELIQAFDLNQNDCKLIDDYLHTLELLRYKTINLNVLDQILKE